MAEQPTVQSKAQALSDAGRAMLRDAVAAFNAGRLGPAEMMLRQVLNENPSHGETLRILGLVAHRTARYSLAIDMFRRAIASLGESGLLYADMARSMMSLSRSDDALATYRKAMALNPDEPVNHKAVATLLMTKGRFEEAEAEFRWVLEREPGDIPSTCGLVEICERQGQDQKAYELLKPLLDAGVSDDRLACSFGSLARTLGMTDRAIELLEKAMQLPDVPPPRRRGAYFVLGDLLASKKEHARAFASYKAGHEAAPRPFDRPKFDRMIVALKEGYSAARVPKLARSNNPSQVPVFILGMPRSGTSMCEQILASHPAVYGAGELANMRDLVIRLDQQLGGNKPYPSTLDRLTAPQLNAIAAEYLQRLRQLSPEAQRITDKAPPNWMSVGIIYQLFPGARIINCLRHPLDNLLSVYCKNFMYGHPFADDLRTLGYYYRRYREMMEHWKKVLVGFPILEFVYEEVVADQEGQTRRLLDFMGLPFDERCLRFHELERRVTTASYEQVRQPLYKSSVKRYEPYLPYLGPLIEELGDLVPKD